jgi:hypothetical protein
MRLATGDTVGYAPVVSAGSKTYCAAEASQDRESEGAALKRLLSEALDDFDSPTDGSDHGSVRLATINQLACERVQRAVREWRARRSATAASRERRLAEDIRALRARDAATLAALYAQRDQRLAACVQVQRAMSEWLARRSVHAGESTDMLHGALLGALPQGRPPGQCLNGEGMAVGLPEVLDCSVLTIGGTLADGSALDGVSTNAQLHQITIRGTFGSLRDSHGQKVWVAYNTQASVGSTRSGGDGFDEVPSCGDIMLNSGMTNEPEGSPAGGMHLNRQGLTEPIRASSPTHSSTLDGGKLSSTFGGGTLEGGGGGGTLNGGTLDGGTLDGGTLEGGTLKGGSLGGGMLGGGSLDGGTLDGGFRAPGVEQGGHGGVLESQGLQSSIRGTAPGVKQGGHGGVLESQGLQSSIRGTAPGVEQGNKMPGGKTGGSTMPEDVHDSVPECGSTLDGGTLGSNGMLGSGATAPGREHFGQWVRSANFSAAMPIMKVGPSTPAHMIPVSKPTSPLGKLRGSPSPAATPRSIQEEVPDSVEPATMAKTVSRNRQTIVCTDDGQCFEDGRPVSDDAIITTTVGTFQGGKAISPTERVAGPIRGRAMSDDGITINVGDVLTVVGLINRTELNGRAALVIGREPNDGHLYTFIGGQIDYVKLRASNLQAQSDLSDESDRVDALISVTKDAVSAARKLRAANRAAARSAANSACECTSSTAVASQLLRDGVTLALLSVLLYAAIPAVTRQRVEAWVLRHSLRLMTRMLATCSS